MQLELFNILSNSSYTPWVLFISLILLLLFVDLKLVHKESKIISIKEAVSWSMFWVMLAIIFGIYLGYNNGKQQALEYFSGYLIEKALAIDNIFVFVMIFSFFKIKPEHQHKVLFWGVIGAIVMRAIAIYLGASLLQNFHWTIYIFGGILILTAIKMLWMDSNKTEKKDNFILRFLQKRLPDTEIDTKDSFIVKIGSKYVFTSLFMALIAIEISDFVFAIDSIPAIFAITDDPYVVFTSNIFAILGLRSIFFVSHYLITNLKYLSQGVATTLIFVGIKMLISDFYKIPILVSLLTIFVIIGISTIASLIVKPLPDSEK